MQRSTGTHHTLLSPVAAGPELPMRLSSLERLMVLLQTQRQALLHPQPWCCSGMFPCMATAGCKRARDSPATGLPSLLGLWGTELP